MLYLAIKEENLTIIKLIIKDVVDANLKNNGCGSTALHLEINKLLLDNGADIKYETGDGKSAF